jgi:hypothetical protein
MAAQALMPQLHVAGWAGSTLELYVWPIDARRDEYHETCRRFLTGNYSLCGSHKCVLWGYNRSLTLVGG